MSKDWESISQVILEDNRENRASVGLTQKTDLTTLQIAALYDPGIANSMLEDGCEMDLHSACALGLISDIERLVSKKRLEKTADLLTPLGFALIKFQLDAVAYLLNRGANPNQPLDRIGFFVWETDVLSDGNWLPIHMASVHGYDARASDLVRLLANHGADIHETCKLGERPIHLAATYSWVDVMATLIELGADVNAGTSPCSENVHRHAAPTGCLPEHDVTPMMIASREGKIKGVDYLLQNGADINAKSSRGRTALHIAADAWWGENETLLCKLLDAGLSPSLVDNDGFRASDYAKRRNYKNLAKYL